MKSIMFKWHYVLNKTGLISEHLNFQHIDFFVQTITEKETNRNTLRITELLYWLSD